MNFKERLQVLRKENNLSQEALAEKLNISRQAVAKWETGISTPDLTNLILLSDLFGVSLDRLVKSSNEKCVKEIITSQKTDDQVMKQFLFEAKKNTYAAGALEEKNPSRPNSHDLTYKDGDYFYIDTYIGSEIFSGEEAVWVNNRAIWAMNYHGRVVSQDFNGKFLKEALQKGSDQHLQRGPLVYKYKNYSYHCKYEGEFNWFQGYEEIFYETKKVYECYFHGGRVLE